MKKAEVRPLRPGSGRAADPTRDPRRRHGRGGTGAGAGAASDVDRCLDLALIGLSGLCAAAGEARLRGARTEIERVAAALAEADAALGAVARSLHEPAGEDDGEGVEAAVGLAEIHALR